MYLCRLATPASASQDSSSARCKPIALVSNKQRERRMECEREENEGHTNAHMLTPGAPAALSIITYVQASPQHQTLHGTEALRNEASQNERDPFVYVDLLLDA